MQLEGIHHVTCITGDAPGNVAFYTGVLGLRLVKKTVNQDDPTVYHLFYADEQGSAGADITFFEYPGARRGRAGARDGAPGDVPRRVGGDARLLGRRGSASTASPPPASRARLRFEDPEGLGLELAVSDAPDEPLVARHPEIPEEHALQGFGGVRAFAADPERSRRLLEEVMGFRTTGDVGVGAAWPRARRALRVRPAARVRAPAFPARAPSTTSPGRRRWRTTRPGSGASPRRACTRRR